MRPDERTGVLAPRGTVARSQARWFEPAPALSGVVDRFWCVEWDLAPDQSYRQRIIATPLINLTIEEGSSYGRFVVTGIHQNVWERHLSGVGRAFGVRLEPAGLAVVSDLRPEDIAGSTVTSSPELDGRLHSFFCEIVAEAQRVAAGEPEPGDFIAGVQAVLSRYLHERPVSPQGELANRVVAALGSDERLIAGSVSGRELASSLGTSERSIQRALRSTVGHGPNWISRRARLQAAALALSSLPRAGTAEIAVRLGYTDQSHLINEFRRVVGTTPGEYVRSLRPPASDGPARGRTAVATKA